MTIGEAIQRVQSLYSKGAESDDTRLSDRHIYSKLLTARSLVISRESRSKQRINQWNYQTLPCVELIVAPIHECPTIPKFGLVTYKTKFELPKPIMGAVTHYIQSVTSLDGTHNYSETTWDEKKYKSGNRYTATKPDYYIRNNHLYVTHKDKGVVITVTGLFEDPLDAYRFPSACGDCENCLDLFQLEFPIDSNLFESVMELAVKEIQMFSTVKEDINNDTNDKRN